jgi:metallo-beta-lactamase family protein
MLLDSAHIQEMESEWQTRKNRRRGKKDIEPLYTTEDAEKSLRYFSTQERDKIIDIEPGIKAQFRNAGHILGASSIELWVEEEGTKTKIVFSGDLGKYDQLIVKDPFEITEADYLFIESTYGNRLHRAFEESKAELLEAIKHAVSHNEKVIIPAFALERTQEVLYLLGEFARAGQLPDIPIYLDSPLAIKATKIFRKNKEYYDKAARAIVENGFDPFDMPNLRFTPSTNESIEINKQTGSAIIISANGMCTAGRIKHHLKHNLWRTGASLIIVGFQAQGTTGRRIVDGAKTVTIFGEKVSVRAKVFTIGGFSAHADQSDLLKWVGNLAKKSRPRVFVVHGEPQASETLADRIKETFSLETYVPQLHEVLSLDAQKGISTIRKEAALPDRRQDMLALLKNIEAEIAQLKKQVAKHDHKVSVDNFELFRNIRDELQTVAEE